MENGHKWSWKVLENAHKKVVEKSPGFTLAGSERCKGDELATGLVVCRNLILQSKLTILPSDADLCMHPAY